MPRWRTAAALPLAALVLTALVGTPASAAPCTAPGSLACLRITSPLAPGKYLDAGDARSYLEMRSDDGTRSFWKLEVGTGSVFRARNHASATCVDVGSDSYLEQGECAGQGWSLVPHSLENGTYRVRQDDTGRCFTLDGDRVRVQRCRTGDPAQEWRLGVGGKSPVGVRDLAVRYAMHQCDTAPDSCSWREDTGGKSPAHLGAATCVSQVVHNRGSGPVTYTRPWSQTVGWQNTLGGTLTLTVETGVALGVAAKVTAAVQANYPDAWIGPETTTDTVALPLRPGEYGWITRRPLLKKVTGTWTLDADSTPWTLPAVLTLPAKDGTDTTSSVLEIRTATAAPTSCRG